MTLPDLQKSLRMIMDYQTFNTVEELVFMSDRINQLMKKTSVDKAFILEQQAIDEEIEELKNITLAIDHQQKLASTLESKDMNLIECAQRNLGDIMKMIPHDYWPLWFKFETLTNQCELIKDGSVEKILLKI